jgi:peptide/nickel transport system substrate-binding protein
MAKHSLSRRQFLQGLGGAAGLASLAPLARAAGVEPAALARMAQQQGGTIVLAAESLGEGIEVGRFTGFGSTNVKDNIFEGLTRPNPDNYAGEPQPGLAESWEISDDGLVYTFAIREGVTFHDGAPLDAYAVERSLNRYQNEDDPSYAPGIGGPSGSQDWESLVALDDMTVQLTLQRPNSTTLYQLFHPFSYITSPAALDEYGTEIGLNPIGTGPFKMERFTPGQEMTMSANEDYWGGRPFVDTIVIRAYPDEGTMLAAIESGEVNLAPYPPSSAIERLRQADNLVVEPGEPFVNLFLGANALQEPTNSRDIRLAVNYAINRDNIIQGVLNGLAEYPASFITPEELGFDPSGREISTYDPDRAREHIAASGLQTPIEIELTYENNRFWPLMAEVIKADLEAVGFSVQMDQLDAGSFWGKVLEGRTQLNLNQRSAWVPDPNNKVELLYSETVYAQMQNGITEYPPEVIEQIDTLIESGLESSDREERIEIYQELQAVLLEWMPYIMLGYYTKPIVMAADLRGLPLGGASTERIFLESVYINGDE